MQTRKYTRQLLELIEDGILDPAIVLRDALNYMSEAEVEDFVTSHEYFVSEDEDAEDESMED